MERVEQAVEGAVMSSSVAKSAPVAVGGAVSGLTFFGVPVPDLVPVLTCLYLVVMTLHTAWKWWVEWRTNRKKEKGESGSDAA